MSKKPRFFVGESKSGAVYMYVNKQMYFQHIEGSYSDCPVLWDSIYGISSTPKDLLERGNYVEFFESKPKRSRILKECRKGSKAMYKLGLISKKRYKKMMRLTK